METKCADTIPETVTQQDEDEMSKDFLPSCQDCRNFSVCKLNREFHNPRFGELHDSLSEAIEGNQLEMYLQFIYNVKERRFTGAEALSRWNHPERGVLSPASYIKGMEFVGLSDGLDFCMLEKSCRLMEQWKTEGFERLGISCNFTRSTFSGEDFFDRVKEIVSRYDFCYDRLTLEMTEDTLVSDKNMVCENMRKCREMGFSVALDDLGAGYSSLRDLCDYPVDCIKLDRSIINRASGEKGFLILKHLVSLAHEMGMNVLCEGVETEEQKNMVIGVGADLIQGFYFSRVYSLKEGLCYFHEHDRVDVF